MTAAPTLSDSSLEGDKGDTVDTEADGDHGKGFAPQLANPGTLEKDIAHRYHEIADRIDSCPVLYPLGHVFQGRFRSTLIDGDGAWLLKASAYLHLNPVRVSSLGLGKSANKAESLGLVKPNGEKVRERLRVLREHRWSSYRAYGNYDAVPEWLVTREILDRAGGRARYRRYVSSYVMRGMDPDGFTSFFEGVALGSREFLDRARALVQAVSPEQPDRSFLIRRVLFA